MGRTLTKGAETITGIIPVLPYTRITIRRKLKYTFTPKRKCVSLQRESLSPLSHFCPKPPHPQKTTAPPTQYRPRCPAKGTFVRCHRKNPLYYTQYLLRNLTLKQPQRYQRQDTLVTSNKRPIVRNAIHWDLSKNVPS